MRFETKEFESSGLKMSYLQAGRGKTILFLHGAGVNNLAYKKNLALFSKKYLLIASDLPGFGKSGVPEKAWSLADYGAFMNNFVESLKLKDFVLIGSSFGGGVATHLAAMNKKVSKLILIDPIGLPAEKSTAMLSYIFLFQKNINDLLIYKDLVTLLRMINDFLMNVLRKIFHLPLLIKILTNAMFKDDRVFGKIKTPTLILWGDKDELLPPRNAKIFNERIRGSKLMYVEGNHDWWLFRPKLFFRIVSWFIERSH